MKTPDKICVAPHQIFDCDLEIQEVGHNGAEEYIRKNALLEWAKAVKHVYELPLNGRNANEICISKADAFRMVIDKLNSM